MSIWLIAPVLAAIPMGLSGQRSFVFPPKSYSTQWYENLVTDTEWRDAVWMSFRVSTLVVLVSVVLGTAAALALTRLSFRGKSIVQAFLVAPLIVPIVIVAAGVYAVFLPWGLAATDLGFVLSHSALAVPFVIITVMASLSGLDHRLEQAGASLGAPPVTIFFRITLPQIVPGMFAGAVFAFITSFDELVVSLFLSGPGKRTVPVQMFDSLQQIDPTIAAASTVLLAATTAAIILGMLGNRQVREGRL
jgi:putative spermidine/putrescine transport system permease protein